MIRKENHLSINYSISYASATVAIIFLQFPENSKNTFNQAFKNLEEYAQIRDLVCHLVQNDQVELFVELKNGISVNLANRGIICKLAGHSRMTLKHIKTRKDR